MLALLATTVTLHVGVPTRLGSPDDLTVEGASGPCTTTNARITCPTDGSVRFAWPDARHVVHGDAALNAGQSGTAWILAAPETRAPAVARLRSATAGAIDRHAVLEVRQLLVFTSDWTPPWPSPALLDTHLALLDHGDPRIRREAVEGLFPWVAGTPFDPLPVEAPVPVDAATLRGLARDPDKGVRRRLAHQLRTARPDVPRPLVRELLETLLDDPHPGVRRATVVALPEAVDRGVLSGEAAWSTALAMTEQPRPPGRAACNVLARLRGPLERAGVTVDPEPALVQILARFPERAWRFWGDWADALPVRDAWIRRLLDDTTGLDPALVRHWHATDPEALGDALDGWTADRHPERRSLLERALGDPPLPERPPETTGPENRAQDRSDATPASTLTACHPPPAPPRTR